LTNTRSYFVLSVLIDCEANGKFPGLNDRLRRSLHLRVNSHGTRDPSVCGVRSCTLVGTPTFISPLAGDNRPTCTPLGRKGNCRWLRPPRRARYAGMAINAHNIEKSAFWFWHVTTTRARSNESTLLVMLVGECRCSGPRASGGRVKVGPGRPSRGREGASAAALRLGTRRTSRVTCVTKTHLHPSVFACRKYAHLLAACSLTNSQALLSA
jgi:hypothetical protein